MRLYGLFRAGISYHPSTYFSLKFHQYAEAVLTAMFFFLGRR